MSETTNQSTSEQALPEAMVGHSQMLGQIASEVEHWCISDQATTLDAVQYLKADWMRLKGMVEMSNIEKRLRA